MIRYALICNKGHEFEAWFGSSSAYDEQNDAGQVQCPQCGSAKVEKALMAPAVGKKSNADPAQSLKQLREARDALLKDADNVGENFASEARKIHYKESEGRGIYGTATDDEAKALRDEGVDFVPLPKLPEDHN